MNKVIEVQNVSKSYQGIPAILDIHLSVKPGEVFGLLGPNGAGKSTAVECILHTKTKDSGTVKILEKDPKIYRKQIFQEVGVQFQESNFQDKITVEEICIEISSLYKETIDYKTLLKQFGLLEKRKSMIQDLSGGQKQKLYIVLALINNPKVVFLDELTTGLDAKARREVWKYLLDLKQKGLTIFLTSHFMDEVEALCDNIAILKQGQIIFHGTVQEAIDSSPYQKLEDAYLWYTKEEDENESI